jgi:hypothetical protein
VTGILPTPNWPQARATDVGQIGNLPCTDLSLCVHATIVASPLLISSILVQMEKESGLPNPGTLFIGAIDFFAVLVPGVIAASLLAEAMGEDLEHAGNILIAGLVTAGWVLGHVLHGIGSWLDPLLYDPLFKPSDSAKPITPKKGIFQKLLVRFRKSLRNYFHKNDRLHRLAIEITDYPGHETSAGVPGGMYQWARAWLNSHSPESTFILDRHEADSKLFRSLAVLFLIAIPILIARPRWWQLMTDHRTALIILAIAGLLFSLWRYCDLRNKMIRQCYLNYVQLRFESPPAAK